MSQNGAGPSEDLMSWRWLLDARPTIIKIIKDHHTYVIMRRPNVLDGPIKRFHSVAIPFCYKSWSDRSDLEDSVFESSYEFGLESLLESVLES